MARSAYFPLLDTLRGVAAAMVAVRHIPPLFPPVEPNSFLAVDLFFVMSGVVIASAYGDALETGTMSFGRFAVVRLARLAPLYLVGIAISFAVMIANRELPANHVVLALFVLTALLCVPFPHRTSPQLFDGSVVAFPADYPTWSIFFELVVNAVYALVVRRLATKTIVAVMALSAVALALRTQHGTVDVGWTTRSLIGGVARIGYSFFAGVLIFRAHRAGTLAPLARLPGIVASVIAIGATVAILAAAPPESLVKPVALAAIFVLFPAITALATTVTFGAGMRRVALFLGTISYGVYVLHVPLFHATQTIATALRLPLPYPYAGIGFLAVLVALVWALDRFYDTPLRRTLTHRAASR